MPALKIVHFSDILCVWAYVGQTSLDRLFARFGDRLAVETRFCSVFPDAHGKIEAMWRDRGGFAGYAAHVREVVVGFPDAAIHDDAWSVTRPTSSASPHLFVKALEMLGRAAEDAPFQDRLSVRAAKELRSAFFAEGRDISDWAEQRRIAGRLGVDFDEIRAKIESGEGIARLAADYELGRSQLVRGSPTYILNEGRQILFGNISYGILEANVAELLSEPRDLSASV